MQSAARNQTEIQSQRTKLTNSYKELLDEFSSSDLRHVGNYSLGRLIGKGSFGKVYLAHHKLTNGSKVVLKSAKKDDTNLAREIHHHRQFLHPHIARLYEVIVTENLVWLVLEYCPGDELYNYLLKSGAMEPVKVQKIFTQLVGAVSYVHNKSCVHRDLKLENILLDKHENVKLVDFGFTREYEGKASYLQTWCGTVCYSAPEMLKGEKYAGEKVDVWSLGIILYALLAGELPFDEDDESATKVKILKDEPSYPDTFPPAAKDLISQLLSKRPILRPSLADILQNPWLAEHAPQQQAILKLQQPAPFTTDIEKETLQRMRSAGVDIDTVIENVLAQRCDPMAGWWALLIEKEERKAKRKERKRREREAEAKSLRRLSAASSALDRLAPTIKEADEGEPMSPRDGAPRSRGRSAKRRSANYASATVPDLPKLPEKNTLTPETESVPPPPPPVEKDVVHSRASSRSRPLPPPKENRRSRSSMLNVVQTNPDLLSSNGYVPKRRRKYQGPFFDRFAALRNWFDKAKSRSPGSKNKTLNALASSEQSKNGSDLAARRRSVAQSSTPRVANIPNRPDLYKRTSYPSRPRITTATSSTSVRARQSLSPSPITPRGSFRRASGLRGRKSTSSSVSSIRSLHHHQYSHSKASSTSSASIASPSVSASGKQSRGSPHTSVKVLPAIPTASSTFPSNIRLVRGSSEAQSAFGGLPPPSPGLIFAKRKRSPFKGPMLSVNTHNSPSSLPHHHHRSHHTRDGSGSQNSRSGSIQGRRSGEVILEEEDEEEPLGSMPPGRASLQSMREMAEEEELEEDEEEEIEEVEVFSPVEAGSTVEMLVEEEGGEGEEEALSNDGPTKSKGKDTAL
ncbi:Pkinase-domain-containing protein [Pseudovirgaria hyperparasitica]|uniref:Pkinase-domain-containing protein n=1 Tax=Pseudovirgaria hyperparasitica TaxID=470096 RepID=A0A6A6WDW0_9PEZI|nr:Pkinase-domain-containing protein [Pseudovirgaria hyperparasitica]KAF2759301.1 Pkinase-domain-containing protein [Pseudovirgaria hyperparasitica]